MRRKPDEISRAIGARIQLARRSIGASQVEFAAALAIRRPSLSEIERGKQDISAARLYEVALLTDRPVGFFFEDLELKP